MFSQRLVRRFNVEVISTESGGEEVQHLYITSSEVADLIANGKEGDDIVIHCLGRQPDQEI